jgi:hypothetical protein
VLHFMQAYSEEEIRMKFRLARLGVLLLPVMGLVASTAPPARAASAGAMVIQGTATVGAGLGYPCVGNTIPDLTKCPVIGTAPGAPVEVWLPTPGGPTLTPVGALPAGGNNNLGVTFAAFGAGVLVKAAKPKCALPACVEAGTFTIAGGGSVSGWCDLSDGQLTITVTPNIVVGSKANVRTVDTIFVGVGGILVITGRVRAPQTAWVGGAAYAVANPTDGSSCFNKAAKTFIIAGAVAIVGSNLP